jgi:chromosome segregation ATPase
MTIDIGALRRFQATWGPVIAVIPDVINMAEQQADFERGLAAKRLELDNATKAIDAAYEEADKRLVTLNAELVEVSNQKVAVAAEIDAAQQAAAEAAKTADAAAKARLGAIEAQITESSAVLAKVDERIVADTAAAQADHAVAVKVMQAEIADLEKRKAAAEKALDTLRAKLG